MRFIALLVLAMTACNGTTAPAPSPPADPAQADATNHGEAGAAHDHAAPSTQFAPLPDARVHFTTPTADSTVTSPLALAFTVEGAAIQAAGPLTEGTGHHHIIVDGSPVDLGTPVPKDATHIHFGKGQVETTLELTPGEHTLTLQLADGMHRSYGPSASTTIKVTVAAP
jgi:hypothetical protein